MHQIHSDLPPYPHAGGSFEPIEYIEQLDPGLQLSTPLSTADVATAAGYSTRTLSTDANERAFAELEAAGMLT